MTLEMSIEQMNFGNDDFCNSPTRILLSSLLIYTEGKQNTNMSSDVGWGNGSAGKSTSYASLMTSSILRTQGRKRQPTPNSCPLSSASVHSPPPHTHTYLLRKN